MNDAVLIQIESRVRAQFPEIRCGGFRAGALTAIGDDAVIDAAEIREDLMSRGLTLDTVTQDPRIAAWRRAIQACGLKAAKVRGSAEQLVRRALRGDRIGGPTLVRLYCSVSAKTVAPLGGYDVERLPSPTMQLRFAQEGDKFQPLGGDASDMPLVPSIPVYASWDTILCWMFNVRDAKMTALSETTSEALFVTEALTREQTDASLEALATLHELLDRAGACVGPIAWSDKEGRVSIAQPLR